MDADFYNTKFECGSGEVKDCSKCRYLCTALIDGLHRIILWHNEGTQYTSHYCLEDTIFVMWPVWQLILANLQASLHAHFQVPIIHNYPITSRKSDMARWHQCTLQVYLPSWNGSTLLQPYIELIVTIFTTWFNETSLRSTNKGGCAQMCCYSWL